MRRWRGLAITAVAVSLLAGTRYPVDAADRVLGAVAGVVRDPQGQGIAEAIVTLEGTSRIARSLADGRFLLDSVLEGSYVLQVERAGYRTARAELRIRDDSLVAVEITLEPDGQQLGEVRITERIRTRLRGSVIDETNEPVRDVLVSVVGVGKDMTTDSSGTFDFVDLPPGTYLLEARKEGFERSRYPVRMVTGIERDVALRLRRGARALTAVDLYNAAMASREAQSRHGMRERTNTLILGRDELARYGRTALDIVIKQSALRGRVSESPVGDYCILVDGVKSLGRGIQSMNEANSATGNSMFGGGGPPAPPPGDGWLRTFFADQVEMVEIYPLGTDHSRTLCGRFGVSSGCTCQPGVPTPPTVVVWLR